MADMTSVYTIQGVDALSGPAGTAAASLDRLGATAGRVGGVLESAFKIAATATVAAGAAMAGGLAVGIKSASDLQQAVANISTIKPEIDTSQVMNALNDMSTRVPQSTKQLGDALYNVFSSMEVTQEQALKLVETFAKGALGAQTDAQTFGTAIMGVLNAYKMNVEDAGHVSDVFFNTVNKGVVTGDELARSLGMVTSSGKLFGATFDEIGALIVGVTKEGGDAAQNINNLNNLFTKIGTSQAAAGFKELGISVTDASGNFRSTIDIMADLQTATAGMTEEARALAIQKIFPDMQARAGALTIMSQLDAVRAALKENQESAGSTAAAYEKMAATFQTQSTLLKNSVLAAATTIGMAFLPTLTRMMAGANQLLQAWQPAIRAFADQLPAVLDAATQKLDEFFSAAADGWRTVGQVFANDWEPSEAIDPFVNAIGTAASVIRDDFLPVVQSAWAWITDHSDEIIGAFEGVAIAIGSVGTASIALGILSGAISALLSPIGLLTIAGATLGVAWTTNFGNIRGVVGDFVTWFQQTAMPAIVSASALVVGWLNTTVIPALEAFGEWLQPQLMAGWTWLTTVAFPTIVTAGQVVVDWFLTKAIPAITEWASWLQPKIIAAWTWFTATALPAIQTAGLAAWAWITTTAIPQLTAWASWLQEKIEPAWSWLTQTALPGIVAAGSTAWDWITQTAVPYLQEMADWMQAKIQEAWSWFTGTALPTIGSVAQTAAEQLQNLKSWFDQLGQALADRKVYEDIKTAFDNIKSALDLLVPLFAPTKQGFDDTNAAAGPAGVSVNAVADAIKAVTSAIATGTAKLNEFLTWIYNIRDALALVENYLRSILQMIPQMPAWIAGPQSPATPRPPGIGAPPPVLQPGPYLPPAPGTGTYVPPENIPQGPEQGPPIPPDWAAPGGAVIQPAPAAPPPAAAAKPYGPIDNSSRAAFARTAWPIFLDAAGGNVQLAQMMIAAAISENGDVGKGGGFIGNNFFGIKAPGPSSATGSFTSPTWEAGVGPTTASFASFPDPVTGANAFMQFLQENPRYAPALAAFQQSGDAEALFRDINRAGYATDPEWGRKIANISRNQVAPNIPTDTSPAGAPTESPGQAPGESATKPLYVLPIQGMGPAQPHWGTNVGGSDIFAPEGTPISNIAAGHVISTTTAATGGPGGNSVLIQGDDGKQYYYAHLQSPPNVVAGQVVNPGDVLGAVGTTGNAAGTPPHLHLGIGEQILNGTGAAGGTGSNFDAISFLNAIRDGKYGRPIAELQQGLDATATSMQAVNTSAAAGEQQLSAVGAQIDPLVGMFDAGSLSASQLADAEILASDNAGVATETTAAYKDGLIDQQTAMLGVLDAFSQTTPAAADMAQGIRDGSLSVDEAAVAFAGLATTTATATGEIGTATTELSQKVPADFATMATDATGSAVTMATDVGTTVGNLVGSAVTLFDGMQQGASGSAAAMDTNVTGSTVNMATSVGTTVGNMVGAAVQLADDWQSSTSDSADTMQTNVSDSADTMNTNASGSIDEMATNVGGSLDSLTQPIEDTGTGFEAVGIAAGDATGPTTDFGTSVDDVGSAAGSAAGPVDEFAGSLDNIEPPDLGDFIGDLKSIQREAERAKQKVGDLLSAENISKGIKGKASGGAVFHDSMYLVGEQGPELFVPATSGLIIPNHKIRGLASGGFVSVRGSDMGVDRVPVIVTNDVAVGGPGLTEPLGRLHDDLTGLIHEDLRMVAGILNSIDVTLRTAGTRSGGGTAGGTRVTAPAVGAPATAGGGKPTTQLPQGWEWVNTPGIGWNAQPTGSGYGSGANKPATPSITFLPSLPGGEPHTPGQGVIRPGQSVQPEPFPRAPSPGAIVGGRVGYPEPGTAPPSQGAIVGGRTGATDALAAMSTRSIASATTMSARVGAALTQMQTVSTAQARNMAGNVTKSSDSMRGDVTTDVNRMTAQSTDDIAALSDAGVGAMNTLRDGVLSDSATMRDGAITAADAMQTGVEGPIDTMSDDVVGDNGSLATMANRASGVNGWLDVMRNNALEIVGGRSDRAMTRGITKAGNDINILLNDPSVGALTSTYTGAVGTRGWLTLLRNDAVNIMGGANDSSMTSGIRNAANGLNTTLNAGDTGILPALYTSAIGTFTSLNTNAVAQANLMAVGQDGTSGVKGAFVTVKGSAADAAGANGIGAVVPALSSLESKQPNFHKIIEELGKIEKAADDARTAINKIPTSPSGSGAHSASDVMVANTSGMSVQDARLLASELAKAMAAQKTEHPVSVSLTLGSGAEDIEIQAAQARSAI